MQRQAVPVRCDRENNENKTDKEIEETNTLKLAYYIIKQKRAENIDENEIDKLDEMKTV